MMSNEAANAVLSRLLWFSKATLHDLGNRTPGTDSQHILMVRTVARSGSDDASSAFGHMERESGD
jgi:hypothetical protein